MLSSQAAIDYALEFWVPRWKEAIGEDRLIDFSTSSQHSVWGFNLWWEKNSFNYKYRQKSFARILNNTHEWNENIRPFSFEQEKKFVLILRNLLRSQLDLPLLRSWEKLNWVYEEQQVNYEIDEHFSSSQKKFVKPSEQEVHDFYLYVKENAPDRLKIIDMLKSDYFTSTDQKSSTGWLYMTFLSFYGDLARLYMPNRSRKYYNALIERLKVYGMENVWKELINQSY